MGHRSDRWRWSKVYAIHRVDTHRPVACTGAVYTYAYRCYEPTDSMYERCIGLAWCSTCREFAGTMVYVPSTELLWDALADLPAHERERLSRSEIKLLDHLDRLVRRGTWPAQGS